MYWNKLWEKKYWFSYGELIQKLNNLVSIPLPYLANENPWSEPFEDFSIIYTNSQFKQYLPDLFRELYARYYTHYCFSNSEDIIETIPAKQFLAKIVMIIQQTYDRYSTLLGIYASEKSKLLDGVKTTTIGVGRFNDTPQDLSDGDEFGDNTHVSNITKSTAEAVSDVDTKINRIAEIDRKMRNIMKDWTDEFEDLFIEGENI